MRVRDVHVINEKWFFYCMQCLRSWERDFEARHADDGHGGDHVAWRVNGHASQPPWVDPTCPTCDGFQVRSFSGRPRGLVPAQR